MIPLDRFDKWPTSLDEQARLVLNSAEYKIYRSIPEPERMRQLKTLLEHPLAHFSAVNEVFFRTRWAEALHCTGQADELTLLEVATGDTDIIPQMMAHTRPRSRYITFNMNKILTVRLREKTKRLPIDIQIIEEDAIEIERYLPADSVDVIAFQHAVNDVIQAILCDQQGIDTIHTDWMETLPTMIRIMQREMAQGSLQNHAGQAFLHLLEKLSRVLKPGGWMVMNHYMYQLDLDWGYPPGLWENFIPITREWTKTLPGCKEVFFEAFDPQWWMFLQKV